MAILNLHPEDLRTLNPALFSDYPVRFVTRRVFSLSEKEILLARTRAPEAMSPRHFGSRSMRPPC